MARRRASGQRYSNRLRLAVKYGSLATSIFLMSGLVLVTAASVSLGPIPLEPRGGLSVSVLDRNDKLLRAFVADDGRWRLPGRVSEVDARYIQMLLAYEDRRFFSHPGLDPLALARAGWQLLTNLRIVSGASTLTMQVARLVEGRHERTAWGKLKQIVRAIQLERRFSKSEILDLYLTRAPFGGNIEGARAAALAYFGKEPKRLSIGEAALLVALPQSPERRRPDRFSAIAEKARNRVLARMVGAGVISEGQAKAARAERVPNRRRDVPMLAAHLTERLHSSGGKSHIWRTTLDRALQRRLETLALDHVRLRDGRLSAALMVVDHTTGEVLARVGSAGYLDDRRFGAIDMTEAVRSPGSTLKPLIYGLAFERGLAHPETLIEDRPVRFGRYRPENFDDTFRGTVTVRRALQLSLNIPAIKVLHAVGPARMIARMRQGGVNPQLPDAGNPSLAIGLGGLGIRLAGLAQLYVHIAQSGAGPVLRQLRAGDQQQSSLLLAISNLSPVSHLTNVSRSRQKLLDPVAAWYVSDILQGTPAPRNARGGAIAYKTGTSYGFRDAWAVGFDGRYVVAAWVGRPDGMPVPGLTGISVAAPLLFDAFARVGAQRVPFAAAPSDAITKSDGILPPPLRRFRSTQVQMVEGGYMDSAVQISFPPDRSQLALAASTGTMASRPVVLRASGGKLPLTWLVNGEPIASPPHRRDVHWQPGEKGFFRLSVIDANGRVDRVSVRFQ